MLMKAAKLLLVGIIEKSRQMLYFNCIDLLSFCYYYYYGKNSVFD